MFDTDLFDGDSDPNIHSPIAIGPEAFILKGEIISTAAEYLQAVEKISHQAPFRHMQTPRRGHKISVAMTNCGPWGWISDQKGYRYSDLDPLTQKPWPPLPPIFVDLCHQVTKKTGFNAFTPDACLINQYQPGNKLSLHVDKDEEDKITPIISVSLGVPATFLFGGLQRQAPTNKYLLQHGDVVIWGGASRMRYHGVNTIRKNLHPLTGQRRINLTFRKVFI